MRYGIFSDVHANLEALESVADAIKDERVDACICAGDIVGYGADPSLCIRGTRELTPNVICGNHDRASAGLFDASSMNDYAREAVNWTANTLKDEDKEYLQGLKTVYEGEDFIVVHGSLDEPEKFRYVLDMHSAARTFSLMRKKVCFIGHSHSPVIFTRSGEDISYGSPADLRLDENASYIVNAGSVGQPRDGDPRACYVTYDSSSGVIRTKRVSYDVKKAQDKILGHGLPPYLAWRLGHGR